jgi:hypothetical protein
MRPARAELFHAGGRTDGCVNMTKLMVAALRSSTNTPESSDIQTPL